MTPRWEVIATELRARVARGDAAAGALGTEQALGEEFGASRITIRRALVALRDEGLLVAGRGHGWRVAGAVRDGEVGWFHIGTASADDAVAPLRTETLVFEAVPSPAEIGPQHAGPALRILRLSSSEGTAVDLTEVVIAAPYAAIVTRQEVDRIPPARLLATKGCELGRTDQVVTAELATEDDAPLGVPVGDPLLVVRRTVSTTSGDVVLRTTHRHPGTHTSVELAFPSTDQSGAPPVRFHRSR